ncbi:alpha/beta fold hydrolase [Faecalicatena fissicatena]|uniref:Alpha/beta hydrolase n=1 Tax=Faecalicatena fissicatena TaxID=290055 RepID=A0ABS2E6T0_9FIRM|nr:alpha/beta hydrolase [Faecalicatena fissicatena]MBM6737330.1 alpha/beta hydrolase [Faecalicatena fissicatena]
MTHLYYKEKGKGKPLILLHGNGEDSSYFESQMDYFSQTRRVIAVDTRGHGRSPRGPAPFTIRQFAEDLREFVEEMGIERADLLGFSDGGNIAIIFALRYPERVDRLILNGANLWSRGVKPSVQIPIILGYYAASFFGHFSGKARANAELLRLMVKDPNIEQEELRNIQSPTLVIAGERDMIREEHTRLIAAEIPGAELRIIPGDHFIAAGNPEAFNREVDRFLRETVS